MVYIQNPGNMISWVLFYFNSFSFYKKSFTPFDLNDIVPFHKIELKWSLFVLKKQRLGRLDGFFSFEKCSHLNQDEGNRLPFFPSLNTGIEELLG